VSQQTLREIDFEHIFDVSPDPVCILDREHNVIHCNQAFNERVGIPSDKLIGSKCFWCMHQTEKPPSFCVLSQMLKEGKKVTTDMPIECLDGWFSVTASPLRNKDGAIIGAIHIARDITESKRADEAFRLSEEKYRNLFENVQDVFYQVDLAGIIQELSPSIEHFSEFNRDELIGTDVANIYYNPEDRAILLNKINENGELRDSEIAFRTKTDNKRIASVNARLIFDADGKPNHIDGALRDITDRKQSENALLNSLSLTDATLDSIHNGILVVSRQGKVIKTNAKFAELWHIPSDILASADDKILLDFVLEQLADPDEFINKVSELYGKPESESFELIYFKDGRIFERISKPMCIENEPIGRVWSFLDITESKTSEDALRASEERYRTLTEKIGEGVSLVNDEEIFVYANPAAEKIFGVGNGELEGLCLDEFIFKEHFDQIKKQTLDRKQRKSNVYELEIVLKDGSKKNVLITATPSFEGNKFIGTFGIFRDITDRKRAEEEIKRKNEELHLVNAEKDKFFSIIAHDLRSPFNSFLGLTQLLAEQSPTLNQEKIQQIAVSMRKSATNLFGLLENLLEWSRMQRGLTTYNPEPLLLMPKISGSLVLFLEANKSKKIDISYDISEDLTVFADGNMFECLIRNLVSNAIKFTPKEGKIAITAKSLDDKWIETSVKDSGIGMNQTMVENLFQVDINTNRKGTNNEPSTGLGLIICKEFVEKHGGKLWVESYEGKGSTFHFTLPAKASN